MNEVEECDACGAVSENCYRCTECGKDLTEQGTSTWRGGR